MVRPSTNVESCKARESIEIRGRRDRAFAEGSDGGCAPKIVFILVAQVQVPALFFSFCNRSCGSQGTKLCAFIPSDGMSSVEYRRGGNLKYTHEKSDTA